MIPTILTLAFSLPRLMYAWPSKVLERKYEEVQSFHDYRKDNNQISTLTNLSYVEKEVVDLLIYHGIMDNNAIAAVLGSIRQESNFDPFNYNSYEEAFGIFQWRLDRRRRLEERCGNMTISCQMHYAFSESDWKSIENELKTPGESIEVYTQSMRKYLRYGIAGNRINYAYEYANILNQS